MPSLRTSLLAGLLGVAGCTQPTSPAPMPSATDSAAAPSGEPLVGTIVERLDAATYTYLRLDGPGERWVAVPATTVAVGTRVAITNPMPMEDFESKALHRTFELVMFGTDAQVVNERGDPHEGLLTERPNVAGVDLADIRVSKATSPDAHTVAEIHDRRTELKDQASTVRGKVVKVTSGVLGRNWVHLRDGSGTEAAHDNDLIVTTTHRVQVNAVITAQGTVRTDKELGSGYAYKVLIEDATLTEEN